MELHTKVCKGSETPKPPFSRLPNHPCVLPCPWGMESLSPSSCMELFLEISPIVPRSGTGSKSSSCNLRVQETAS